jgi:hypothetical protein
MDDVNRSPLSKRIFEGSVWVDMEIYQLAGSIRWQIELLHQDGSFTVWLRDFSSDHDAEAEVEQQISEIGLARLISGIPHFPREPLQ